MAKNLQFLNYVIYLLLLFYLVIDTITGISLSSTGISFSIPYKLFIMSLMIVAIGLCNLNHFLVILFYICWLVVSFFVMTIFRSENIYLAIQTYAKFISGLVFYLYFASLNRVEKRCVLFIKRILLINALVFALNIFAGILGFGYSTYSYGIGIKGFFYAGNEIFLILLSIATLLIQSRNKHIRFITSIVSLVFAVLIGTKTAMLALFIIISVNFFEKLTSKRKLVFFSCLPLMILAFIFLYTFVLSKTQVFEHLIYNIQKNRKLTGSLLSALFSGRLDFLYDNLNLLRKKGNTISLIFGGNSFYNSKSIEIDFFDAIILNGIFIAISMFLFYSYLIAIAIKRKQKILIVLNFMILAISFIAGHIWANLTGGLFFIIANVYFYIFKNFQVRRKQYVVKEKLCL